MSKFGLRNYFVKGFSRFISFYKFFAILFLNTLILFVILNIILFYVIDLKNNFFTKKAEIRGLEKLNDKLLLKVYPGYKKQEIDQLLQDTWGRGQLEFEEYTQFKERVFSSKYVNISQDGYRFSVPQGPWPPDPNSFNIFIFGGSTTFGYGVSDHDTIATYLQKDMRNLLQRKDIVVYNFGRGYYISSQESIFFARLLAHNYIPDMAIFIDGLNDFIIGSNDKPAGSDRLYSLLNEQSKYPDSSFITNMARIADNLNSIIHGTDINLPIVRLANYIKRVENKKFLSSNSQKSTAENKYENKKLLENVVKVYLANKKITEGIAYSHKVAPLFVVQPIPFYKYNLKYSVAYNDVLDHSMTVNDCDAKCYALYGYPIFANEIKGKTFDNLLWLADMQENQKKPLYVDTVHYTADMSRQIASGISSYIFERRSFYDGL